MTSPTSFPRRRGTSRWHLDSDSSRLARATLSDTLGYIVDIGVHGFRLQALEPIPRLTREPVFLVFHQPSDPPTVLQLVTTTIWRDPTHTSGIWLAGFRIDEMDAASAVMILRHVERYRALYRVTLSDRHERCDVE